tara:strand:+ start:16100 stop:16348 length:249 start_codon:yes stop_codon:yes gene_type:complete
VQELITELPPVGYALNVTPSATTVPAQLSMLMRSSSPPVTTAVSLAAIPEKVSAAVPDRGIWMTWAPGCSWMCTPSVQVTAV